MTRIAKFFRLLVLLATASFLALAEAPRAEAHPECTVEGTRECSEYCAYYNCVGSCTVSCMCICQ